MIWLFVIMGVVALISAFALTQVSKGLPKSWHTTQGTITHSEGWEADVNGSAVPAARVRFTYEVEGIPYAGQQGWAHGPQPPREGASVTVYYDPAKPHKATVAPFAPSNSLVVLMYFLVIAAVGLFAAAVGIGMTSC